MKQKHWLICVGVVAAAVGVGVLVPRANWGTAAIILLCPAMHLFMMKGHGSHENCKEEEKKA